MTPSDFMLIMSAASLVFIATLAGMMLWLVHENSKTRAAMSGYVAALAHTSRVADYRLSTYSDPESFRSAVVDFSRIMRRADRTPRADFYDFWEEAA